MKVSGSESHGLAGLCPEVDRQRRRGRASMSTASSEMYRFASSGGTGTGSARNVGSVSGLHRPHRWQRTEPAVKVGRVLHREGRVMDCQRGWERCGRQRTAMECQQSGALQSTAKHRSGVIRIGRIAQEWSGRALTGKQGTGRSVGQVRVHGLESNAAAAMECSG